MRSGVIAQKVGMTRIFTEAGEHVPVTVLKLDNCRSWPTARREERLHRAAARRRHAQGRTCDRRPSAASFAVAKVEPKRKLVEFRVSPEN